MALCNSPFFLFCQLPATAVQHRLAVLPNGTAQASIWDDNGVNGRLWDVSSQSTNAHVNGVLYDGNETN